MRRGKPILVAGVLLVLAFLQTGCGSKATRQPIVAEPVAEAASTTEPDARPHVITDFDLKIRRGTRSFDCVFVYTGKSELWDVNVTIQAFQTNTGVTTIRQTWDRWRPGEEKIVVVEADAAARFRRVHLQGGGYIPVRDGSNGPAKQFETVFCAGHWNFLKGG